MSTDGIADAFLIIVSVVCLILVLRAFWQLAWKITDWIMGRRKKG